MAVESTKFERPRPRRRRELEAALRSPVHDTGKPRDIGICLVAGPKDHGPGEHEYLLWQQRWAELLRQAPGVSVRTSMDWPTRDDWSASRLVVFYFWHHDWTDANYADLDKHLGRGGGVVAIHSAVVEDRDPARLARRFGLAGQRPRLQYRHGPLALQAADATEGAFAGLPTFDLVDETYWEFDGDPGNVNLLATAREAGQTCPLVWTHEAQGGRVLCAVPGHFLWTFDDPLYRLVLLRGMAWAAGEPLGRWESLASRGVTFADS